MSAATQVVTQKHMLVCQEGRKWRGGGGLCGETSLAHVFGTGGDRTNRILGHAPFLHSRTIGAISLQSQK